MMTYDEALAAANGIKRRALALEVVRVRIDDALQALMVEKETRPLTHTEMVRFQLLNFQGRILLNMMGRLADEASEILPLLREPFKGAVVLTHWPPTGHEDA